MNLSNDDLEIYVEKFRNVFYRQNENKLNENDMWSLIENLTKEVEVSKDYTDAIRQNFKLYLETKEATITTNYVAMEEKLKQYENKILNLNMELKDLHSQMSGELESQKNEFERKMCEIEENYKYETTNLKNKMEGDKICFEAKEKELYNELQIAQAASAIQCDEIESNLKRQLVDANNKLRQSQNVIRNLQIDINNLKNQLTNQQNTPSHQKYPKSMLKYDPLPLTTNSTISQELEDVEFVNPPIRSTTPLIYKGVTNIPKKKQTVPPLKPCSGARSFNQETNNKTIQKRRKLYNPDDTSYLDHLEEAN